MKNTPVKSCPRIPADAEIAEWLPNCPQEARTKANALLVQVIPGLVNLQWHDSTLWELLDLIDRQGKGRLAATGFLQGPYRIAGDRIAWDGKRLRHRRRCVFNQRKGPAARFPGP